MFAIASKIELCATPPVSLAIHSAAWLATGMKVGLGSPVDCSVCRRTAPFGKRWGRSAIAPGSDCMTSSMIVRWLAPRTSRSFAQRTG